MPARPACILPFAFAAWLLLTLFSVSRATATETVLLGDRFGDNERATQTLPGTAKWFYSGVPTAASRLWVTPPGGGGELRMVSAGSSPAMALTYFTASGSPKTLAAGESIALEFTAKLDALKDSDANLRVMLFNSLGSRPTADSESGVYPTSSPSIYANTHSGYQMVMNTGATAADSFNILERNNQGNGIPFALGTLLGADNLATLNLKLKQSFAVKLKITRSTGAGTSVTIDATVNGVTVTRTDSSSILTSFDGFGLYISDTALGSGQALTVDNVLVSSTTAAAVTTTLLNDTFTDNDRTNQALPTSSQWFYAGQATASARLTAAAIPSAQTLVFTPGGSDAMCLAYFTASGSPRALAVGDSITVQANVHLDLLANAADGFRFGLFNSGGVRPTADNEAGVDGAGTTYNAYLGYSAWLNPGASGGFNLYRRAAAGTNPFSTSANTLMGTSNTADLSLSTSPDTIPRFSMTITRLSSGTQIQAAINGRNVVRTETTAATTSFDTLAFFVSGPALYDGPQAIFSNVNVIHANTNSITSLGKIHSQTFDGTSWTAPGFVGAAATGTVSLGTFGTINVLGSVVPSAGMKLTVNSAGISGYWSGALDSGLIPVSNTETNLGKLTLAFDLRASAVRPVRVRIESADSGGTVGGALERVIYPAVAGSFQRYAFELSDMTAVSGTFSPTAVNVKLTFQIEGGVDAGSWPAGNHALQLDNVYYARPAYYVKPGGTSSTGLTETAPFGSISQALTAANRPGDIILIMGSPTVSETPDYNLSASLGFSSGGAPGGWVTLKNYPGQHPLIKRLEPTGGSYDLITITKGSPTAFDYTTSLNYIEVRGLRARGTADTLAEADRGQPTAKSNLNGLVSSGRNMVKVPHHIRFADNEVYQTSAAGIGSIDIDWFFVENNDLHDTSNWTIYGTSGISSLTPSNFDGTAGTYHHYWLNNRSHDNQTFYPTASTGTITDGNGAIIDTFLTTRHGPYLGRVIAANNLFYDNGGSGIHALRVNGADIVNNTVVRNSRSPDLNYGEIFTSESNDIVIANNIMVALAGEPLNNSSYSSTLPRTTGLRFLNNLYLSEGSTRVPYSEPNDSGNLTTSDVKFVDDAGGDFRLRTGSPAFNAGLATLNVLPVRDFWGVLRATDGLPDIGACERQPAIVTPPVAQTTAVVGDSVTLGVTAQSGGPGSALTYQWQRNGVNLPGATGSQLTLANLTTAQAGSYRAIVSTPFDSIISPASTLTVWTQLQNWRYINFNTTNNSGFAADTADPDSDGIPNLIEYSLNLDPNTASLVGVPVSARDANGRLTLSFRRARSDVTYLVEGTSDLLQWTTVVTNPGAIGQTVTVTDTAPADAPQRFLRLRVTNP